MTEIEALSDELNTLQPETLKAVLARVTNAAGFCCASSTGSAATAAAQEVLNDEANSLALLMHDKTWETLPHRAKVAIRREVERLRATAEALTQEPQPPNG